MNPYRKQWNRRHQQLLRVLSDKKRHEEAIDLFLQQHAEVHSRTITKAVGISFQDEILAGLTGDQLRVVPVNSDHSIVWILWHITRIEDVTMSVLVEESRQVFDKNLWKEKLGISLRHTGNAMSRREVSNLSSRINIEGLLTYRNAVGTQTKQIVLRLDEDRLLQKSSPVKLQELLDDGSVLKEAEELTEYWGKRTIAELLLMPSTRHSFIHLNEARRLRSKHAMPASHPK
jgi:hypothetical protein